ncbi:hypothetical protein ACFLV7_01395 [Chloroflexota bacterium]
MVQSNKNQGNTRWILLSVILIITITLNTLALSHLIRPIIESGKLLVSIKWQIIALTGLLVILFELGLLIASWTDFRPRIRTGFKYLINLLAKIGALNIVLLFFIVILYPLLIYGRFGHYFEVINMRLALLWTVVLGGSVLINAWELHQQPDRHRKWVVYFTASLLFSASGYLIATYITQISTYPFTLHWSETSRYYYASLFFSNRIYGTTAPPTVLHPSRYIVQAIPFLIPGSPLWTHRAWQVFLWVASTLITSAVLAQRLSISNNLRRWMFIAWTFLFLFLGPVFYHLQTALIIILLGFYRRFFRTSKSRIFFSLLSLLLASAWAGISRINWFPVPGMLAAVLFFLEEPVARILQDDRDLILEKPNQIYGFSRSALKYALKPVAWIIFGVLVAFMFQALYIRCSGNQAGEFTSSFTSDLLWYRLLPNSTYPPGILLAILGISLPLFILIWDKMTARFDGMSYWRFVHPLRWLGLATILLVLFISGSIVSTKIGGGSNLHNLDAYMVVLLVITAFIFFDRANPDIPNPSYQRFQTSESLEVFTPARIDNNNLLERNTAQRIFFNLAFLLAILIPSIMALSSSGLRFRFPDQERITKSLAKIAEFTQAAREQDGEVLFITNRHLLTFNDIEDVHLISDYEKVFLMEMAMAGNQNYLGRFRQDLSSHRFALIVSDPIFSKLKGSSERFGEENDAWVTQVAKYIECYYEPDRTLPEVNIQLLTPKLNDELCP